MKHSYLFILATLFTLSGWAQTTISGKLLDNEGAPVPFANVFIKDSYDGASSDINGVFSFKTTETGEQTLAVSAVGYQETEQTINVSGEKLEVDVIVEKKVTELDMVVITAGAFEASDEKKAVVLKPLDIVTTAGAAGDVYGALQTLPGVSQVGEQEGLFVRGGSAAETKTIIDEMVVQSPFFSSVPDVPQRGRFSPFLFEGTVFSSGGYSAIYGQALSSALILNTTGLAESNRTGIGILPIGGSLSHTQLLKNKKTSYSIQGSYSNLQPYFLITKQLRNWIKVPESIGGSLVFRHKTSKTGILKVYTSYDQSSLAVESPDLDQPTETYRFSLDNRNLYTNVSWKEWLNPNWSLFVGTSYAEGENDIFADTLDISNNSNLLQSKTIVTRKLGEYSLLKFGGEWLGSEIFGRLDTLSTTLNENYYAGYVEADIFITSKLAGRVGLRAENSALINQFNLAPRTSLAYKTGKSSQVSVAWGNFYQTPEDIFLFQTQDLDFERADHYIVNYQRMKNDRTFRVELYHKEYKDLVTRITQDPFLNNSGFGYARGIDFFWRDKKTLKNTDYWISYSYLDTKRLYRNFPIQAPPTFVANHNATLVYKYWWSKIRSSFGVTYGFATGRPYFNPNLPDEQFHSERTPNYHNLSINYSKLTALFGQFTVIFASVGNVTNRENVFGYRYSSNGQTQVPVRPAQLRSFFAGLFISIGD